MGHVPVYIYYDASQDISWNYYVSGGSATIGDDTDNYGAATTLGADLSGAITIPSTIPYGDGDASYNVTGIGQYAFYGCTSLTSIDLSGTQVTTIDIFAFYYCTSLTSITIPDSVTTIDTNAFRKCTSLTSIDLSGTQLTTIGLRAFYQCTSLTSIDLFGTQVETIGDYAFNECTSLTSIDLSGTQVTIIGQFAFYQCSSLTSIHFPNSLTTIGASTFTQCSSLNSIDLSGTQVETIGYAAFGWCSSLTSIDLGNSVETIDRLGFYSCYKLTSITIPDSVTTIDQSAFNGCSSLTSVTLPTNSLFTTIGSNAFQYCSKITSLTIPDSVTTIGSNAFQYCTSLTSITIPDSVTTIGLDAFYTIGSSPIVYVKDVDPNDAYTKTTLENTMSGKISSGNGAVIYTQWVEPNYAPNTPTLSDISCNENTAYTATVSATDDNGDALTFSLSGADAADFTLSGTDLSANAVLSANDVFDYETDASYNITITASDGSLNTSADFTITVNNVVETASDLYNANVQGSELKTNADGEGITSQQLLDAGYTVDNLIAAGICFPAGTPVNTDQGTVAIDKIDVSKHTIRGKRIVAITQTITHEKHIVCIKKDAFAKNVPCQDTLTTQNHCFFYNGNMVKAKHLVNKLDNVVLVKYDGCILYNVLQDKHETMVINNLIAETFYPEHGIAKMYRYFSENKVSPEMQYNIMVQVANEYKKKNLTK